MLSTNQLVVAAAPAQATCRKHGARVRAPGAAGAGAPHPHNGNYGADPESSEPQVSLFVGQSTL